MSLVLDEAVLRHPVGDADVMRRQLSHLCEMSRRSHIVLQVLPIGAGAHRVLGGSLTIFSFADGADIASVVSYGHGDLIGSVEGVHRCRLGYDRACADALSPKASRDLIASLLEEPDPWSMRQRT